MKKKIIIILTIIIIIILAISGSILYYKNWYNNNLKAVSSEKNGKTIHIEIKPGTRTTEIAKILEENKIIKNANAFKIYLKLNKINNLQAGKYVFDNGKDNVGSVAKKLSNGEVEDTSVKITLVEGKTFKDFAQRISEKTNNSVESIYELLNDEEYINSLIEKYWFITDEIKNEDIYYDLEGYLKPDTYIFENKDVSVKEIFNIILNFTDKFLSKYKEQIENSNFSVHQILSLASIIKKESSK